jgi:hypothetical protein
MMIHFRGLEHLDKPGVLLFPKIEVCLDCGLSRFTVSDGIGLDYKCTLENKMRIRLVILGIVL